MAEDKEFGMLIYESTLHDVVRYCIKSLQSRFDVELDINFCGDIMQVRCDYDLVDVDLRLQVMIWTEGFKAALDIEKGNRD